MRGLGADGGGGESAISASTLLLLVLNQLLLLLKSRKGGRRPRIEDAQWWQYAADENSAKYQYQPAIGDTCRVCCHPPSGIIRMYTAAAAAAHRPSASDWRGLLIYSAVQCMQLPMNNRLVHSLDTSMSSSSHSTVSWQRNEADLLPESDVVWPLKSRLRRWWQRPHCKGEV